MNDDFPLDFSTLRKGMVLGPGHRQFKLIKPVSNSPIGQVWHAEDLSLTDQGEEAARVALEIVNPALLKDAATVEIFKTQVTLCKQLEHKHIARTYGYFLSREGWLFVAMEATTTRSLARILLEDGYQQLSADKARIILTQVAQGLDHAQQQQHLSHGDLTPWNIIITRETGAKLVNFAFRQPLLQQIQTLGHRLLNTEYHPPEAFDHVPLPATADVYSLACLAYQLFTGRPPFDAETPMDSRDPGAVQAPPKLTEAQWVRLRAALSADPAGRPASAGDLVRGLQPGADESRALVVAKTPAEAAKPKAATRTQATRTAGPGIAPALGRLAGAVALFGAGVAAGYLLATQQSQAHGQALLQSITAIQQQLAQAPTPAGQQTLNQHMAQLRALSDDPALLDSLQDQLDGYRVRLTRANAPEPPRPRPAETRATAPLDATSPLTTTAPVPAAATPAPAGAVPVAAPAAVFKPGAVFKDEVLPEVFGPNMVVLPAGTFRMGDIDRGGDDNEVPVHPVSIERPFALSEKEVTFAEYDLFALSTGRDLPNDEGWGRGQRPVINVSWNDANAYARWIRHQTGLAYRLPSEAEWEYAARAGTETRYWWGDDVGSGKALCDGCGTRFDGLQTAPAGSFAPNPFGLYDMNGNVYEWVSDCYNDSYAQAPDDGSSWNQGQCQYRVMRGGSWYDIPRLSRSASRYRHPPNITRNTWGFRLALDLDE